MGVRLLRPLLLSALALGGLAAGRAISLGAAGADDDLAPIRAAGAAIAPLHERMGRPRPGDWLYGHKEVGQTFDAYRSERPNRPDDRHTTLYLQPIGHFRGPKARLLERTGELLGLFYNLPVKTLDPIGLDAIPARSRRRHPNGVGEQVDSLYVLELLKPRRPEDAVAVLALSEADLWPDEPGRAWNFVFGQASLRDRVGVWSIARFGDPDEDPALCLRRTLMTAVHETGHMLGIRHCTAYECGMNGSNSLSESDRRPLAFCPECEMKVWWSCRADPPRRYRRLARFADEQGLHREARVWKNSLSRLEDAAPRSRSGLAR